MVPLGTIAEAYDSAGWYHNRIIYLFYTLPRSTGATDDQHLLYCAGLATGFNYMGQPTNYLSDAEFVSHLAANSSTLNSFYNKMVLYFPSERDYLEIVKDYVENAAEKTGFMLNWYTSSYLQSIQTNVTDTTTRNILKGAILTAYASIKLWAFPPEEEESI